MTTTTTAYVRVKANPLGQADKPWLVFCALCNGDGLLGLFAPPLGFTTSWRTAQDYAHQHALAHEATRCVTCLHVPAEPLARPAIKGRA